MNLISAVIVLLLALYGLAELCRAAALRLFSRQDDCTVMYITPAKTNGEDVEYILRSALSKRRWQPGADVHAVCLDAPLSDETRRVCEAICREYGVERLMTRKEFLKALDKSGADGV